MGKTTIARVFAKGLNCDQGPAARPCGECGACREIDEGRHVDLIEVDAASRARVEETRDLLDNVQYAPIRARFKVYLIDEVHMFSRHSFNALLKTLEEPPPHVKFLLATTDPQRLPVTVLSRCLQFGLRRLGVEEISGELARIAGEEAIEADAAALRVLGRAADGSMRDALSLLDQAAAYGAGRIVASDVRALVGTVERERLFALLEALAASDTAAMIEALDRLAAEAADFEMLLGEVVETLGRMAALQVVPAGREDDEDVDALRALAARITPEALQLHYQIGIMGRRDLPYAPHPRAGFEMTMLRMAAFAPAREPATGREPGPSGAAAGPPAAKETPRPGSGAPDPGGPPRAVLRAAPSRTGGGRGSTAALAVDGALRAPHPQRGDRTARRELRRPRVHRDDGRPRSQPGTRAVAHRGHPGQARVRAPRLLRPADAAAGRHRPALRRVSGRPRGARREGTGRARVPGASRGAGLPGSPHAVRGRTPIRTSAGLTGGAMKGGLGQMLRQAQENLQRTQEELASLEVTGSAGGGVVTVTLNGRYQARGVSIDDSFVGGDREMLEDLVAAAINDAVRKVEELSRERMTDLTAGLGLPPGLKLPF